MRVLEISHRQDWRSSQGGPVRWSQCGGRGQLGPLRRAGGKVPLSHWSRTASLRESAPPISGFGTPILDPFRIYPYAIKNQWRAS